MVAEGILEKYKHIDETAAPDGFFTNFLGVKTRIGNLPQGPDLNGKVFSDTPGAASGDGVFAGQSEYNALLTALDACVGAETVTIAEFGAGWGPWISAAGVVARRMGIPDIRLIAVEADAYKHSQLLLHMEDNGLVRENGVTVTTHNAAISHSDGVLHFPKDLNPLDYGGQASETGHSVDYRGMGYQTIEVPALSIETVLKDAGPVDYLHVDIQGAEYEALQPCRSFLTEHVKYMFIGTHSRMIDGQIVELLHEWDWQIHIAHPCGFVHDRSVPTLEGMTVADGEVFASNPRLTGSD